MSFKKIVQDYFKASLDMNTEAMAKDFARDIEIQNISILKKYFLYFLVSLNCLFLSLA